MGAGDEGGATAAEWRGARCCHKFSPLHILLWSPYRDAGMEPKNKVFIDLSMEIVRYFFFHSRYSLFCSEYLSACIPRATATANFMAGPAAFFTISSKILFRRNAKASWRALQEITAAQSEGKSGRCLKMRSWTSRGTHSSDGARMSITTVVELPRVRRQRARAAGVCTK